MWALRTVQRSALCRSRRELLNDKLKWNSLCEGWDVNAQSFHIDNPRRCPLCEADFTHLGQHITAKHPVNAAKFVCEDATCRAEFLTKKARTQHMETAHGIDTGKVAKRFQCPHDGCKSKPFRWNSELQSHLKRVHKESIWTTTMTKHLTYYAQMRHRSNDSLC